ncbi:MAG TPA: flavodoxin domain-containing protein [Candidatus Dormibacteraeota bacterium]|nr:flavodoxin domain-containing protein [Candidatus Dormibacteraeota bacterium]
MRVLVVYASKYGATKGIAERITATLNESGVQAAMVAAKKAGALDGYDAYVIGSAAYMFSWLHEATDFVRRNAPLLKTKPVWLFSSGPIGAAKVDEQGRDVLETSAPKEFAEFEEAIKPRGKTVFFGAFDHTKLSVAHRVVYAMPAMKKVMVDGDWRDWDAIDAWARSIAAALTPATITS